MRSSQTFRIISLALLLASAPATLRGQTPNSENTQPLQQLNASSQALYKKISASLIHVRIDQNYVGLLTPAQRTDFQNWTRTQGTTASDSASAPTPTAPPTIREQRRQTRAEILKESDPNAGAAIAARPLGQGIQALFRKYAEQRVNDTTTDPALQSRLRALLNRMQQPPGEMLGIVIDTEGHALVLGAWVRDAAPVFLRVTAPDGTESNARYIGAHPGRGLAVIKLDSTGVAPPLSVAHGAPAPGELLMCLNGNNGAVSWIASPGSSTKNPADVPRFPVAGGEGPTYLFNTQGQLAGLGFERFALPMSALNSDIQWIIANHKDIAPRQIGVKYAPVTPIVRRNNRLLGNRPAVLVQDITPGSPAEKSGLRKNDIVVTIDRRPIWQIAQIQWDIATRTDSVPIGIIRDQKEITLDIPLTPAK